jgi:ankyrin repeat protein
MGSLDLIKEITDIPHLIKAIDNFTRYRGQDDKDGYFAGKEREFTASNFGGYVNPLIVAINNRQVHPKYGIEIIQFLLNAGADPDAPDLFHRQSPLFVAAVNGDHDTVSLLLDSGADQHICSYEDGLLLQDGSLHDSPKEQWKIRLPLDGAVRGGHLQIVKLLIKNSSGLVSCPFHLLDLKTREPSPELIEIFRNLHISGVYPMNESQKYRLFRWFNPTANMRSRQSARIKKRTKNRRDKVNLKFQEQFAEFESTWV